MQEEKTIKIISTINIENIVDHTIETDYGKEIYLDEISMVQIYTEWDGFKTIIENVEKLEIHEEENGTNIIFVCNEDCVSFTRARVFVPFDCSCNITGYNPLFKDGK